MGKCIYCQQPAGFLKNKHAACHELYKSEQKEKQLIEQSNQSIKNQIVESVAAIATSALPFEELEKKINDLANLLPQNPSGLTQLILKGWRAALDDALKDGLISEEEERRLMMVKQRYSLSQEDLEYGGAYERIVKSTTIRDVLEGIVPQRFTIEGGLPINLQKGEKVVWVFSQVEYLEDQSRRQYVGGSRGVSVRVAKGLYFRAGAFKGHSVSTIERVSMGKGVLYITNKHIYFTGAEKNFRVPYSKIVSFEPFSNGIGITRDAANAKPQLFIMNDGWFIYNLVTNLAQL